MWESNAVNNVSINLVNASSPTASVIPIAANIPASTDSYLLTLPATVSNGGSYDVQISDDDSGYTNVISTSPAISIVGSDNYPNYYYGDSSVNGVYGNCDPSYGMNSSRGNWVNGKLGIVQAAIANNSQYSTSDITAITVISCAAFNTNGSGGSTIVSCPAATNYSYCVQNPNDGLANSVLLGVTETKSTFVAASSTPSQYIPDATGATSQADYNLLVPGGYSSTITEVKFTVTGANTVAKICIGSVCAQPVNGVADLTGLQLANGSQELVQVSYAPVGVGGLASGTTSAIALTYVAYTSTSGGGFNISTGVYTPASTTTQNLTTNVAAPIMALVGSMPTGIVFTPSAGPLINGSDNLIGGLTVYTSNQGGSIRLNTITFKVGSNGFSSSPTISAPRITIGTTTVANSSCSVATGSIICTLGSGYASDYQIAAGQGRIFNLYATVAGSVSAGSAASISLMLTPAGFIWDDASANGVFGVGLTGSSISNFPVNSYAIKMSNLQNGTCGSINGTTVASVPAANLCSSGTASSVYGPGPWGWSCIGSNGGTTASCSASYGSCGSCSSNASCASACPYCIAGSCSANNSQSSAGTLATPTLIAATSTPSQYISDAGGAANATQAVYNFVSNGGTSTITELKFTVTPSNTVTNICAGSICTQPVGGLADLKGLQYPLTSGAGISQAFKVSYGSVIYGDFDPGATSTIALTSVVYTSGGTTHTLTINVPAPTMTLVGSAPTVSVSSATNAGLIMGINQISQIAVSANSQGPIKVRTITFNLGLNGFYANPIASPYITNGTTIIAGSSCTVSGNTIVCSLGSGYASDYSIVAGQSQPFKLYATVNGSVAGPGTVISTSLVPSEFVWDDTVTNGAYGTGLTGSLIYNFPTSSYSITANSNTLQDSLLASISDALAKISAQVQAMLNK